MTSKVTISPATVDDLRHVVELLLHLDAHVAGVSRDVLELTTNGRAALASHVRSLIENPYKLLLLARHPRAGVIDMGSIALWKQEELWENPERQGQWYGVIDDVWVDPGFRRRGINRLIVAELAAFARAHQVEALQLEYSASNREAAAAWKRLGFRRVGIRAASTVTEVQHRLDANE